MRYAFGLVHVSWSAAGKQSGRTNNCMLVCWYDLLLQHLRVFNHLGACFGVLTVDSFLAPSSVIQSLPCTPYWSWYPTIFLFFPIYISCEGCVSFGFHIETCLIAYFKFYVSHVYHYAYVTGRCCWYPLILFVCCKMSRCGCLLALVLAYFMFNSIYWNSFSLDGNSMQYHSLCCAILL